MMPTFHYSSHFDQLLFQKGIDYAKENGNIKFK